MGRSQHRQNREEPGKERRGEEQEARPAQEDQLKSEVSPRLEGHQNPTEHTGSEIPQRPGDTEEKQQGMEEEEKGDWAPGSERVPERGMDRDVERPPLGEGKDQFNSTCREWRIIPGGWKQHLQQGKSAHRLSGPPGPLSFTVPPNPAPKGSTQKRGQSPSPAAGAED